MHIRHRAPARRCDLRSDYCPLAGFLLQDWDLSWDASERTLLGPPQNLRRCSYVYPPSAPRGLLDASNRLKTPLDGPKMPQETSKRLQDASKTPQDASRCLQDGPRRRQDAHKTPQDASKTRFWLIFDAKMEQSCHPNRIQKRSYVKTA